MSRPSKEVFVENLSRLLKERELTQAALARAVGVHRAVVNAWVSGAKHPEPKHYDAIADALGVPVSDLFWDATDPRSCAMTLDTAIRIVSERLKAIQKDGDER